MPNKNTKKQTLPSVEIPSPVPNWLKGCSPLLAQAKILSNQWRYKDALLLAGKDFKLNPSPDALDIICDCYIGMENKKGFNSTLNEMEKLKYPKGYIYLNKALSSLIFMKDIKKYNTYLDKAETCLKDLPNSKKADFYLFKHLACNDDKEKLSLLDNALAYQQDIAPQITALIHYYKALSYMYFNDAETAYKEAEISIGYSPEDWEGHYARALAGCTIMNLEHFLEDCELVLKHEHSDEESKQQMNELKNTLIEKLLHPKDAKVTIDGDCLLNMKDKLLTGYRNLTDDFIGVNTFERAREVLCEDRLNLMIEESIESATDYAEECLEPIMTDELTNDLKSLKKDSKILVHKEFLPLFKEVHKLIFSLEDFMTEEVWCKSGQPIVFNSITGLTVPVALSVNLPHLQHLKDEKADGHIQKIRQAVKKINDKYSGLIHEFIYNFTMTAAKYDADISIPDYDDDGNKK